MSDTMTNRKVMWVTLSIRFHCLGLKPSVMGMGVGWGVEWGYSAE
jgi:hypothetical protein